MKKKTDQVRDFVYLHHKISCKKDKGFSVNHRIRFGLALLEIKKFMLKSTEISVDTKTNISRIYKLFHAV